MDIFQEVWMRAYVAAIQAKLDDRAVFIADKCLKAFQERFYNRN